MGPIILGDVYLEDKAIQPGQLIFRACSVEAKEREMVLKETSLGYKIGEPLRVFSMHELFRKLIEKVMGQIIDKLYKKRKGLG